MEFSTNRRKAVALVALVFLLGIAFGVVGVLTGRRVLNAWNQGGAPPRQISQLMRELNLTADQEGQFRQVLADTRARYEAIRRSMDPQFQEARQRSRERIQQVLTAEQRPGFDDFLRRSRNRRNGRGNETSQVTRLTEELRLTAEQRTQLSEILRETRASFDALRQQMNPQFEEARLQNRERLRQIVTPEQRQGLDGFFQRRDEVRRRR
jgi:Spy/CpxP family protein refolding chaperone